jgi:hypothetical protein
MPASGEILIRLSLHPLPTLGPKPTLVGRDRALWAQLQDSILALGKSDLSASLV